MPERRSEHGSVTAADIARLAGVGRAAVSNWRRRHPDFPRPVGGTVNAPLFSLAEVTSWLRGQGKLREIPVEEEAWQRVRAAAADASTAAGDASDPDAHASTADMIAEIGALFRTGARSPGQADEADEADRDARDAAVRAALDLAAAWGPERAFEFLVERHTEARSRRSDTTPPDVAALMAALVDPAAQTVLDPACGPGTLLLALPSAASVQARPVRRRLLGQEREPGLARIAGARLALRTSDTEIRAGDALRHDAFPGLAADAVLCDPPFHDRHWGHEELTADPRWEYGLPPRMEPELAWVQHALAHLVPGGFAAVLMPPAAAGRRSGRRIRAELLRRGALRAVAALSDAHHLWLLRRPSGGGPAPAGVLMVEGADARALVRMWREFERESGLDVPGVARVVAPIDLLGEEVDLAPGRYVAASAGTHLADEYLRARDRLAELVRRLDGLVPTAEPETRPRNLPETPVAELVRIGAVTVMRGPTGREPDAARDGRPLLTADDVAEGRAPSGRAPAGDGWDELYVGDIVVTAAARRFAARVIEADGALLGPHLWLLRVDPAVLDPYYLAGLLRATANERSAAGATTGGRVDPRRARVPRLPLDEQRGLGAEFRRAQQLEDALRAGVALGGELTRLLADGVAAGRLRPPDH